MVEEAKRRLLELYDIASDRMIQAEADLIYRLPVSWQEHNELIDELEKEANGGRAIFLKELEGVEVAKSRYFSQN